MHRVDAMATAEVCRCHGLSPRTFYKLKARYGAMNLSDAQWLKSLEDDKDRLKRRLPVEMLDNIVLKDLSGPKPWVASGPRTLTEA